MELSQKPQKVTWPQMHYVYIEKKGPFMKTAHQAWQELRELVNGISEHNQITGYMSLYKMHELIYRDGVTVCAMPKKLPKGIEYSPIYGGEYSKFVLKGPYTDLPEASRRVFDIIAKENIPLRIDFCI
jgi:effector-binding domain-containing protein